MQKAYSEFEGLGGVTRREKNAWQRFIKKHNELNKNNPSSFELHISTESGEVISMYDLDVRILKKLNHFLTYALEDTNGIQK